MGSLFSSSKAIVESLAFPAPACSYGDHASGFQSIDGVATIYHKVNDNKLVILYSHGNATDIGHMNGYLSSLSKKIRTNIMAYDYEGYGMSVPSSPSEAGCIRSINKVYEHLILEGREPSDIILYGVSIGTGVTVDLAAKLCSSNFNPKGVLLQSPYTTVIGVITESGATTSYYTMPSEYTPNILRTNEKIDKVTCPITIIHGEKDNLIPIKHANRLKELNNNIKLTPIANAGHNGIENDYGQIIIDELLELKNN